MCNKLSFFICQIVVLQMFNTNSMRREKTVLWLKCGFEKNLLNLSLCLEKVYCGTHHCTVPPFHFLFKKDTPLISHAEKKSH